MVASSSPRQRLTNVRPKFSHSALLTVPNSSSNGLGTACESTYSTPWLTAGLHHSGTRNGALRTRSSTGGSSRLCRSASGAPLPRKTPGTAASMSNMNAATRPKMIVALSEGRGQAKGEVGLCAIDLAWPVVQCQQIADSFSYVNTFTALDILEPSEILVPHTFIENNNQLVHLLETRMDKSAKIISVQRKYFNESKGVDFLRELSFNTAKVNELEHSNKYYALASASALLSYVEFAHSKNFNSRTLKLEINFGLKENSTLSIDFTAIRSLELIKSLKNGNSSGSNFRSDSAPTLMSILNHCKTGCGQRLLRSNILKPPCHLDTIQTRLEAVSELCENEHLFYSLENLLDKLADVEYLVPLLVEVPKSREKSPDLKLKGVILLKHALELVEPLKGTLSKYTSSILKTSSQMLDDDKFVSILQLIDKYINEETRYQTGSLNQRTQMCFALKPGLNGMLDVCRRTYTEIVEDIHDLVRNLSIEHSLPLKINYNATRNFFMQMFDPMHSKTSGEKKLPETFVKITKHKGNYSFTTEELLRLNDRLNETLSEIFLLSSNVIEELILGINQNVDCIYKFIDAVSLVDMLYSLANYRIMNGDSTCPEFTDTLCLESCNHPAIVKLKSTPIANNVYSSPSQNINIITGENMSGKSTYLKMIAWVQIMTQIGSYLPASYASIKLVSSIYTRITHNDSIEQNLSTFQLEMTELDYIVRSANDTSLVLIDELARGTDFTSAQSICIAALERLSQIQCTCFFVTHFTALVDLEKFYPNFANWSFVNQQESALVSHGIAKGGGSTNTCYGLKIARSIAFPKNIIDRATQIAMEAQNAGESASGSNLEFQSEALLKNSLKHKLFSRLRQALTNSNLEFAEFKEYLMKLQKEIVDNLSDDL